MCLPYLLVYGKIKRGDLMELLQLRYFCESAKTENIAATAQKYMVPASSVSTSIKRLETELGTELFDRTSNRIKLNEKGSYFAAAVTEALDKLDQAVTKASNVQTQNKKINILIRARNRWISKLIIEYMETNPSTQFQMAYGQNIEYLDEFDVIIDEDFEKYSDMKRFLLAMEPLCIKASKNSPLLNKTITFNQLRNQPFIMPHDQSNMSLLLNNTAKRYGFTPIISVVSSDKQCRMMCVEAGMGLTIGSKKALSEALEEIIAALDVSDFNEVQSIYVYHRTPKANHKTLKSFLEFLKSKRNV